MDLDSYRIAQFWTKAEVLPGADSCWQWKAAKLGSGYGCFTIKSYPHYAHRIAWELIHGTEVPDGKNVCHRCDNPLCVNPRHLFVGTPAENVADAIKKGRRKSRRASEPRSNAAKLSEDEVKEVIEMAQRGFYQEDIAKKFGMSRTAITLILKGVNWRHVK